MQQSVIIWAVGMGIGVILIDLRRVIVEIYELSIWVILGWLIEMTFFYDRFKWV